MIGFENAIMAQTVPRAVSMSAAWCTDPPSYAATLNSTADVHDQQQQQQQQQQNNNNMQHYGAATAAADLDNFDLSLLLPQPTAAEPTSSADGRVPAVLGIVPQSQQQQQDDHQILSQLTGGTYQGPNCYGGADTLDTLDLTQLLSLYDDYCTAEATGNFQDVLLKSSAPPAIVIKEEVDDFTPSPSASPSAFISSSSSPRSACGLSEVTYNVNCTWFVKDEPSADQQPTSADLTQSDNGGKRQTSSVLLRSLLESTVKDEPNDCAAATAVATVQSTTDDDGLETKPDLGSADSKASSHKLLIEMLRGPKEERSAADDDLTASTTAVGSTSPISAAATSSANSVADLAELLLYSACSSSDQGVPTDQQFDDDNKTTVHKSSDLQRASHRKWTSSPEQQQWAMVGQQHQWSHSSSNSPSLDMTVPSLSPQQNGGLNDVELCASQALFDDTAALVDGLLFGDGVCRDFKSETSSPASPQNENREDEVRIRAQMDMWKSLLLQQEQQDDDHRQKRNASTDRSNGQQPPMKRQRIDHEQDTLLSTTSLSPLGSFSPASSTSSGGLPLPMLDVNDNIMSIPMSVDCGGDKDEEDEYYAGTAATSPSSSTRSPGSSSAGSSGTAGSGPTHHHHHIHLWQFLKELLQQHDDHAQPAPAVADDGGKSSGTTIIRWLDRPKGVFKIEDSVAVAKLWGRRKNRPAMNYDKLSRSIRQYYKKGIMKKTERSQRLVYQFCHPYSGGSPSTAAASPGAPVDV